MMAGGSPAQVSTRGARRQPDAAPARSKKYSRPMLGAPSSKYRARSAPKIAYDGRKMPE